MDTFLWFVLLLVFVAVEAATVSVVSTWFAVGALGAMVSALLGAERWVQIVLFIVLSAVSLAMLRPIVKKHFTPKIVRTNVDALVGKTCMVTSPIDNLQGTGKIKLGDVEWSARSQDGRPIDQGVQVKIERIEGVKVYVTKLPVEVK